MDDDGDYFTWTLDEAKAVLTEEEASVAALYYDINEVGEMHHNPAKNVLYIRASLEEIAKRLSLPLPRLQELLDSAKKKLYAARLARPTPYVDKTMYVGWNALCVSAYLEAAKVLDLGEARHFALRSLDRILSEAWRPERQLLHVMAYSDAQAERREIRGVLDDYAFTVIACLDAYEATADLSYFHFAQRMADKMVDAFFDPVAGGFFDTDKAAGVEATFGVLGTRRKPFQDSPTPAGNSAAAIALLRMYSFTNDASYRDKAEQTLEVLAGMAGQYGLFAATYGIAAVHLSQPHTQVVVLGDTPVANQLYRAAVAPFALNKSVLKLEANKAVPENLPRALAETIPQLPVVKEGNATAVVCSNFACQAPVSSPEELEQGLRQAVELRSTFPSKKRGLTLLLCNRQPNETFKPLSAARKQAFLCEGSYLLLHRRRAVPFHLRRARENRSTIKCKQHRSGDRFVHAE